MVGLENLFRRLGFDVLSVQKESQVASAVLGFPPDLIIASGSGRSVNGLALGQKLRVGGARPHLAVFLSAEKINTFNLDPNIAQADVDAILEMPFQPESVLKVVSSLLSVPIEPLLGKYKKILTARLFEPELLQHIKETEKAPDIPLIVRPILSRSERYQKFLTDRQEEKLPPIFSMEELKANKLDSENDSHKEELAYDNKFYDKKFEEERLKFLKALFESGKEAKAGRKK